MSLPRRPLLLFLVGRRICPWGGVLALLPSKEERPLVQATGNQEL